MYNRIMHRVRVKICGLTDPAQAREVARLGADAIGVVFADSPRQVDAERAREIVSAAAPFTTAVGIFVDAPAEEINALAERTGIACAQLHGQEPPEILPELHRPAIKAFGIRDENSIDAMLAWLDACPGGFAPAAVLLDAYSPRAAGGTGETFNWDLLTAAREAGRLENLPPILLAGGLEPANAAEAIRAAGPWGLDVSSGVEASPGNKDMNKVAAFLHAAWDATKEAS